MYMTFYYLRVLCMPIEHVPTNSRHCTWHLSWLIVPNISWYVIWVWYFSWHISCIYPLAWLDHSNSEVFNYVKWSEVSSARWSIHNLFAVVLTVSSHQLASVTYSLETGLAKECIYEDLIDISHQKNVVWKRCRDGVLPICWPLLSFIIPTLFA